MPYAFGFSGSRERETLSRKCGEMAEMVVYFGMSCFDRLSFLREFRLPTTQNAISVYIT